MPYSKFEVGRSKFIGLDFSPLRGGCIKPPALRVVGDFNINIKVLVMNDLHKFNNKDNILKVALQTLSTIIDDIPNLDKTTNNAMKELAKLFLEETGNKYSSEEIIVKFMSPEMSLQRFKKWIKSREDLARSLGL